MSRGMYGFSHPRTALPVSLSDLVAWYDVSRLSGYANNDPVNFLPDLTGWGNHLVHATANEMPLYKTSYQGSMPGLYFDGSNDYLQGPEYGINNNIQPRSVCAVIRLRSLTNRCSFFLQGGSGTSYWILEANTYNTVGQRMGFYHGGDCFDTDATTSLSTILVIFTMNAPTIGASISANTAYYVNGVAKTLTLKNGDGNFGTHTGYPTYIGYTPGVNYSTLDFFEMQVWKKVLDSNEITSLTEYFRSKWAIW